MAQRHNRELPEAGFEPGRQAPNRPVPLDGLGTARRAPVPLHPQHPGASGHKATWRRSRGRAWERARGPAPPAKMFPLCLIDRFECRETKLFMR